MQADQKSSIVVVGSINMDLVLKAPRHPQIGETILASDFHTFPGGKGANQSVAVARLGGHVSLVGRLGKDPFGDELLTSIRSDGIDSSYLQRTPDAPTGVALITVSENGDNTIVVVSGANACVTTEDVKKSEPAFKAASILLIQLELPDPAIAMAVAMARKYNLKVILNPAPARELDPSLLGAVDYLIPNRNELAILTGSESTDPAISMLLGLGVKNLIVTLGEEGAYAASTEQRYYLPAFRVQAVDATAAGDAFVGAFSVALNEGMDLQRAVIWANAAGALAVTRAGAQPSLPNRCELEEFIQSRKTS